MSNQPSGSPLHRIKPTQDTKFHIDYSWWDNQQAELQTYILSLLPEAYREMLQNKQDEKLDWVDPETAEVHQIDPMQQALREAFNTVDFTQMPLVDAVFRVFLTNGNKPLSPNELEAIIGRPANTILRTLAGTGGRVYRGLRPAHVE